MNRADILAKVAGIVDETLDLKGAQVDESTNLKELGADSFDLLELVTALEDEFGLTLDDEAVENIATVGQVVDAIENAQ